MPFPRRFKQEVWWYTLAFAAAVLLRFTQLGAAPLTDLEAEAALQALRISQGFKPALGAHPFYVLSTAVLFFLYGGGMNFLARFFPALAGSLLVFVPALFPAERVKPRSAVLLAFFFALDPGLVALSRLAASPIFAIVFTLSALGFFLQSKQKAAGVTLALAILSGPAFWLGALGLAISWGITRALFPRFTGNAFKLNADFGFSFAAAFLLFGSLFMLVPNGLSAAFSALPAFITRWLFAAGDLTPLRMAGSLLVYQPLGVLLLLTALIRGWIQNSARVIPLSVWFFVSILLAFFLPSREMGDLVWALIPLWALAAIELTRHLDIFPDERKETLGAAALVVFIWVFGWLYLSDMAWATDAAQYTMRFWMLAVALFLLVFSLLLIALGWSARIAQLGAVWGFTLALGVLGLSGAFGAAGLRGKSAPEMWNPPLLPAQADLLSASARDLSEWGTGDDFSAEVALYGFQSPALEWLLREHPVTVAAALDVSSAPAVVITPQNESNPALSSSYRGQDFLWRQTPAWSIANSGNWLRWLVLREMPQNSETIILWAREDLFIHPPQPSTLNLQP